MMYPRRGSSEDSNGISIDGGDEVKAVFPLRIYVFSNNNRFPTSCHSSLPYRLQVLNDQTST
jgi:hypothetical protein